MDRPTRTSQSPSSKSPLVLPADALGRVACVIIGSFFGVLGGATLATLIKHRPILDAIVWYELSLSSLLFGTSLFAWGLFAPVWIGRLVTGLTRHFMWLIMALFLPFAIEAILVLLQGDV